MEKSRKSTHSSLGNLIDGFFQSPSPHTEQNKNQSGGQGDERDTGQFEVKVQEEQQTALSDRVWMPGVVLR